MYPQAFINRIQAQLTDAEQMLEALSIPPVTSIRKHPIKGTHVDVNTAQGIKWCPDSFYLPERPVFTLDPAFHAGAYYVQESSSMFLWHILENIFDEKNVHILDLCAAPGGKSTLIASWLNGEGLLVSNEVIRTRASVLLENMTKWGYANTFTTHADAYVLGGLNEFFDCIVIDAPCSGEGLFRKDKNAVDEWSEANCDLCASRQKKITGDILPALKEGGYLIYSTCTFNPAENDENIKWMLQNFPLEVVKLKDAGFPEVVSTEQGGYAFYPHHTKGEGFYCCVLRKTAEMDPNKNIRRQKLKFDPIDVKKFDPAMYVKSSDEFFWFDHHRKISGIHIAHRKSWEEISAITKILGGYLAIGELKGKDLVPDHGLAMSIYLNPPFQVVELDKGGALRYLSRKDFLAPKSEPGWTTINYQSLTLGFAKILPGRVNNYYPQEWRIRMEI